MVESRSTLYRLGVFVIAILGAANLIVLSLHLSTATAVGTHSIGASLNSNNSAAAAGNQASGTNFGHTTDSIKHTLNSDGRSIAGAAAQSVNSAWQAMQNSAASIRRNVTSDLAAAAHTPRNIAKFASSATDVNAFIRPAENTKLAVITSVPDIPALPTAILASKTTPQAPVAPQAQWPIHGAITTLFGVPEWPYEAIHTGLDISDGKPPGITPILPFKPGVVTQVIHSDVGLGNHIVIDHGGGVASVYGHLYSISVQPGRHVDDDTILGYEGSTGASTGTHLHFEIRINGQPEDPQKFINGKP